MEKKYVIILLSTTIFLLIFISIFMLIVDPFYIYHQPYTNIIDVAMEEEAYQNIGAVKNFTYDTIITGSSMTENFVSSDFDETFQCKTLKVPFSGAMMQNYDILLANAFQSNNNIKNIFIGLDTNMLMKEPGLEAENKIAEYTYDNKVFTKVNYLLNKKIISDYAIKYVLNKQKGIKTDLSYSYFWDQYYIFSKEEALKAYERPDVVQNPNTNLIVNNAIENLKVLEKYIKNNPNTNFYIFYPPYSMLTWDYYIRLGEKETVFDLMRSVINNLLNYANVKQYYFHDKLDVVTNLDNYKDYKHYSKEVNKMMLDDMYNNNYILNEENYLTRINNFEAFVTSFNYDEFMNL